MGQGGRGERIAMRRVCLLVNGPGELWGWARPLVRELSNCGFAVTVWLLSCPFATGLEELLAGSWNVEVVGPNGAFREFWEMRRGRRGIDLVLQLGGDLFFGRTLARAEGSPLACYTYGYKPGLSRCAAAWTAFECMAEGLRKKGIRAEPIGDLVADALMVDDGISPWSSKESKKIALFPGSRPAIRKRALSYLGEVVKILKELDDGVEFAALLSPFCTREEMEMWFEAGLNPTTSGTRQVLADADMALTQPGTNTLELLHMAVPALVVVPFAFLRDIPVSGVKGWASGLPVIGGMFKEFVLRMAAKHRGYLSWPNRIAGHEVLPEVVGVVKPQALAQLIFERLSDREWQSSCREELRRISAESASQGASARLCARLKELIS